MEKTQYKTTRIWTRTLMKVRLIAALTDERMVQVLDRLAEQELARVQQMAERAGGERS